MSETLEYRGYIGSAEVDTDNNVLVGKLLFIRDTITYSARTPAKLRSAFKEAVDDYLATCAEEGDEPDVPFKGTFNVRVGPERHRAAAVAARHKGIALNEFICFAIDCVTDKLRQVVLHQHEHQHEVKVTLTNEPQFLTANTAGHVEPAAFTSRTTSSELPKH